MIPLVSPPEFAAYPNYLDLDQLVPGQDAAAQTAELVNALLRASAMVNAYCRRKLQATMLTETLQCRRTTKGYPFTIKGSPFIGWNSITYTVPDLPPQACTNVDLTAPFLEEALWRLPLWSIPAGWSRVQLTPTYTAGFTVTSIVGAVDAEADSIIVADPTGIEPGLEMRIWDPAQEEYITVASGYTVGDTTVPLVDPLLYSHEDSTAVDALPEDAHEAVILWTMGLLARPANGGEMDPFSDSSGEGPTTEGKDPRRTGRGLIAGAKQILDEHPGLVRPR
jgi:hypothetical protein